MVPILGPLLFILYVNDVSKHLSCPDLKLADDTSCFISGSTLADVSVMKSWCSYN